MITVPNICFKRNDIWLQYSLDGSREYDMLSNYILPGLSSPVFNISTCDVPALRLASSV